MSVDYYVDKKKCRVKKNLYTLFWDLKKKQLQISNWPKTGKVSTLDEFEKSWLYIYICEMWQKGKVSVIYTTEL